MDRYGVFINYRSKNCYMAGRIYDYLKARGLNPFMDIYSLHQGEFDFDLQRQISQTPYFLCILSEGCLENLDPENPEDTYFREIVTALASDCKILMVAESRFSFPAALPEAIKSLAKRHYYFIDERMSNFYSEMDKLCTLDIDLSRLDGVVNWREYLMHNANVFVASRAELENGLASLNNRFGSDLVECIKAGQPYDGPNMVKHVNMFCYAASIIFAPARNLVDHQAYDYGTMFNIFATLLRDEDFSMTLITSSPDSPCALDAVDGAKLGNSSLEERAVFLGSYASIQQLLKEEPYLSAKKDRRFRHLITEAVLPFAYFQIVYKSPWSDLNHIKIDLYTEGLISNTQRRSMVFFEKDHPDTYALLENQFLHLQERAKKGSKSLIKANNDAWIREWASYLEDNE